MLNVYWTPQYINTSALYDKGDIYLLHPPANQEIVEDPAQEAQPWASGMGM